MSKSINLLGMLLIVAVAGYVFINFTNASKKNIDDLKSYLEKSGLSISPSKPLTENEQRLVESVNKLKKSIVGQEKSDVLVDAQDFFISTIPIKIYQFENNKSAKEYYANALAQEVRSEERSRTNRSPYTKKEFSLNENLVMQISYYEVNLRDGGLTPTMLELDAAEVSKVKSTFMGY